MAGRNSFWTGSGLILVAAISFGLQSTIVKKLFGIGANPFQVLLYELALASLLLGGAALVMRRPLVPMSWRDAGRVWFWGLIGVGGTGLGLYGAVERIPVALAVVLLFYYVPWVFFLEYLFLKIKPSPKRWVALLMILGGTLLASDAAAVVGEPLDVAGVFWGLTSGVCYGTFIFAARRLGEAGTPLGRSFVMCAGTFLLFLLVALLRPRQVLLPPEQEVGLFFALVVAVTLFGQVLPLLAFSRAIPIIGGSLAAIIASVELPVASLVAFFLLGESLHALQWGGIFLISASVVVANWRGKELRRLSVFHAKK